MPKKKDKVWRQIAGRVKAFQGHKLKIGVLASQGGNAAHPDSDLTVIELAAIHEFGAPKAKIPERSFIRSTLAKHKVELVALKTKLAKLTITNKMEASTALKILGEWIVAKIRSEITNGAGIPPPLKEATIAKKGSSRPLVDTGRLLGAITYSVDE